jgi:uncharacterized protein (TIGR03118 family)
MEMRRLTVKGKFASKLFSALFIGLLLFACGVSAQTKSYQQTDLVSSTAGPFNNQDVLLANPWGIAFGPGDPFFVASTRFGQVRLYDAAGNNIFPLAFRIPPSSVDPTKSQPTGIVFNPVAHDFILGEVPSQYVVASADGTISGWAVENGAFPTFATLGKDDSHTGAIYTGVAILNPAGCAEFLVAADFHNGRIQILDTQFHTLATQGDFTDPHLPAGFAPFNIQQIGNKVFVTYALQNIPKTDPVIGAGNGIVDIFDQEGNFVRRFATGDTLNAPWGVTLASANFGPLSNDVLISNFGDGTISAFDPTTGNFVGQIKDGDGNLIANPGIRGLAFRADGVGDPNTLYFAAGSVDGASGLFGGITAGLASSMQVSVSPSPVTSGSRVRITITVSAGPSNTGSPTGEVVFQVDDEAISSASLINGIVQFDDVLSHVGTHIVRARYAGDATFLASTAQTEVQVTGQTTTVTLAAPASATSGSSVKLEASVQSQGGIPTGAVTFSDGSALLGAAPVDATGVATLNVTTLAVGAHSVTAAYGGDNNFAGSNSAAINITISSKDFSIAANPPAVTVVAGQSAQFTLTVTPAGGFADSVTFSCEPVAGITCTFAPPAVTPTNGTAVTTLTVTTAGGFTHIGYLMHVPIGSITILATLGLLSLLMWQSRKLARFRASILTATAVLAFVALSVGLAGCSASHNGAQTNGGTTTINVLARSGDVSHATTVSVTVQ